MSQKKDLNETCNPSYSQNVQQIVDHTKVINSQNALPFQCDASMKQFYREYIIRYVCLEILDSYTKLLNDDFINTFQFRYSCLDFGDFRKYLYNQRCLFAKKRP